MPAGRVPILFGNGNKTWPGGTENNIYYDFIIPRYRNDVCFRGNRLFSELKADVVRVFGISDTLFQHIIGLE